jgi:NADP-dependent 3-hydroxy acid dehydrogenase YdfG
MARPLAALVDPYQPGPDITPTHTSSRRAGFTVWATARNVESLEALRRSGCNVLRLDVTDGESVDVAVKTVEDAHGHVAVLVNNAGIMVMGPIEELSADDFARQYDTNVFGYVRMIRRCLPGMRAAGTGRIINIGSIGGLFTSPGGAAYQSSKYATESITDALRMETTPMGVRTVLIQPGGVATAFGGNGQFVGDENEGPYAEFNRNLRASSVRLLHSGGPGVLTAEKVARRVAKAATSRRPKPRYRVGVVAHGLWATKRLLPDSAFDASMRRGLGM